MTIELNTTETKGYAVAKEENVEAGKMTFVFSGTEKLIIDHTEVNPDFAGKGVGKKLLMEIVNFSRKNNIKIIPLCPYAKSVFEKTEDIRDVLA